MAIVPASTGHQREALATAGASKAHRASKAKEARPVDTAEENIDKLKGQRQLWKGLWTRELQQRPQMLEAVNEVRQKNYQ